MDHPWSNSPVLLAGGSLPARDLFLVRADFYGYPSPNPCAIKDVKDQCGNCIAHDHGVPDALHAKVQDGLTHIQREETEYPEP